MISPPDAPVFWLPQEDTSVVVLTEAPPELGASPAREPVEPWRDDTPIGDDDAAFRFALGNGQRLQIIDCAIGGQAVAVIPLGMEGFDRIEAIYRFLSALHGRAIPPDTRLTRQQRARQRRMVRAFDGERAGATQQEIAEVLFNIGHLGRDEWQASSARHRIKTLLRDARAMVAGGYRKLLRHRRPR
ncbi:DUF2285 domain-containing protein [Aminobacter sp. BE322]|uniref:DUF2285 domain-containing protein n=1 Tax=unclassified Aminobacter TaxID=2644704 RepID=UPI003D1C24C9